MKGKNSIRRTNFYMELRRSIEKEEAKAGHITVGRLKSILDTFSDTDMCYAYEGEICGIVIISADGKELGYIDNDGEFIPRD